MQKAADRTILLVDDHQTFLTALSEILRGGGNNFRILTAENGVRALKVLEFAQVDVVVTDLRMPVMNGFDLISRVKEKHPTIPVIVVSSFLYPEAETRLKALGISQYIEKQSLTADALQEMILRSWD